MHQIEQKHRGCGVSAHLLFKLVIDVRGHAAREVDGMREIELLLCKIRRHTRCG